MENTNQKLAYDGHCAFAVSIGKLDVKGGKYITEIDNVIYKFSNPIAKILFKLLPNRVEKANKHWNNRK